VSGLRPLFAIEATSAPESTTVADGTWVQPDKIWQRIGVFVFVVAAFLLVSMGGAIVAAPITVPLMFLVSRRHPTAAFRTAGVVLGGLTVAEAVWALTYFSGGGRAAVDLGPSAGRRNECGGRLRDRRPCPPWSERQQGVGQRLTVVMTDERLLVGFLVVIGLGVSFALTVFALGVVVLVAVVLGSVGLVLWSAGRSRSVSGGLMVAAVIAVTGPVIYIGLALLHS